jgi:arylsulfatase
MAHTYFPVHLWLNEHRLHLQNDTVAPHTPLDEGADPYDPESYARFSLTEYAPEVMFNDMTGFIKANSSQPFFVYWASPIPHVPLQAPDSLIEYYVQKFGDEPPYTGDGGYFPQRYPHATYAAMVSFLDDRIGKLIDLLKEEGVYEETLIIFTSDNGPTYSKGTDSPWFKSGGPFKSERGWGKGFVHEAGIRVPMIASWPGHIDPGTTSNHISAFWDMMPTLCEAVGADIPEQIDGISFLPTLLGEDSQEKHPYLYWEFPAYSGQQAVRMDQWKGLRKNIMEGNLEIELYNLDQDPQEQQDLADQHPEIVQQMEQIMKTEHTTAELEVFRMEALEKN